MNTSAVAQSPLIFKLKILKIKYNNKYTYLLLFLVDDNETFDN